MLRATAGLWGHEFELCPHLIGGAAIEAAGCPLPADSMAACEAADAFIVGAVGGPRWDGLDVASRPERGLLQLRKEFDLFANLRPVKPSAALVDASPLRPEVIEGVDLLFVRELTGGLYFGPQQRQGSEARDTCVYSADEITRIVRVACDLAARRRGRLTSVDKANVLETSRLWREVAERIVTEEYPEIELEHLLVDAMAMHLLVRPRDFDVIVTENMFGDILTDEASVLAGSMGLLPSASLGVETKGLYEPVHGSAPDIAGKGMANPFAAILCVALLLRHSLGLEPEASSVEAAVGTALAAGCRTADIAAVGEAFVSTEDAGAQVLKALRQAAEARGPAG